MNHHGTIKRRITIIGIVVGIALMVTVCLYLVDVPKFLRDFRHSQIANAVGHKRIELINEYSSALKIGMNKSEVWDVLGPPDNTDNEYIWYWCWDDEARKVSKTWREYSQIISAKYLLFTPENTLASFLIKNAEDDPWESYHHMVTWNRSVKTEDWCSHTESLFGPAPKGSRWFNQCSSNKTPPSEK